MNKINVLEIKDANSYLIKQGTLESRFDYLVNGKLISSEAKKCNITILKDDVFQSLSSSKELIDYRRGEEVLTTEEFRSKRQYYDEDDTDEDVLRAIANKKELQGFEPFYKDPEPRSVEISVVGFIEDTGSNFISASITVGYGKNPILYVTSGQDIAMSEYKRLSNKFASDAKFEKPDRRYLRFTKINGSYVFGDHKPFGDYQYRDTFANLTEAKEREEEIRESVKSVVMRVVFKDDLTEDKKTKIVSQLRLIKKLKTKKSMDEVLSVLIKDIQDYKSNCN